MTDSAVNMLALVEHLAKAVVEAPDEVTVEAFEEGGQTVLELIVAETDLGRVIGRLLRRLPPSPRQALPPRPWQDVPPTQACSRRCPSSLRRLLTSEGCFELKPRQQLRPGRWRRLCPPASLRGRTTARPCWSNTQYARASIPRWRDRCADYRCRPLPPSGHRAHGLSRLPQCGSKAVCAHRGAIDESLTQKLFPFLLGNVHTGTHSLPNLGQRISLG